MHIAIVVLIEVVCLAAGYAFRGLIHKELGIAEADLRSYASRIEAALGEDETTLRNEASIFVAWIKAKLNVVEAKL